MFPVIFYFTMWYFLTLYQGWGTQQFPKGRSHLLFACPSSKGPEKRSKACKFVLYWNHNRIIWRKYHLLSKVIPSSKISHILHFPIDTFCYSHLINQDTAAASLTRTETPTRGLNRKRRTGWSLPFSPLRWSWWRCHLMPNQNVSWM